MGPWLSSLRTPFLRLFITDTEAEKSVVVYGRRETGFFEGEKSKIRRKMYDRKIRY
jgi:hypothetical protein